MNVLHKQQTHSAARFSLRGGIIRHNLVIAFLLMAVCVLAVENIAFGQSFTAVNYNFPTAPAERTTTGGSVQGEYIYAAANGYGQWVVVKNGSSYHWALLADSIANPVTTVGASVPSGEIHRGDFPGGYNGVGDIKVATNLNGSVRYVSPNAARTGFVVMGFDDKDLGGMWGMPIPIDISFTGYPNATNSRNLIKQSTLKSTTASIADGGTSDVIASIASEMNWRDAFDIAMDEKFLYIVWRAKATDTADYKINITIVDLATHTTVSGYPKRLHIPRGVRPTVACDIRANSSTPHCVVTYIVHDNSNANGDLYFAEITGTTVAPNNDIAVTHGITQYKHPNGTSINIGSVKHARVVMSNVKGTSNHLIGIYFLEGGNTNISNALADNLLFYLLSTDGSTQEAFARYADGGLFTTYPLPIGTVSPSLSLINEPVRAVANPYDGEGGANYLLYDEFHCLYELEHPGGSAGFSDRPVCIIRGSNNGATQLQRFSLLSSGTTDTRRVVSSKNNGVNFVGCPDYTSTLGEYSFAVNQKGLHPYWKGYATSALLSLNTYYNRDTRKLDEDIEENTLLSYSQYVADGSSHDGTVGATLLKDKTLTLWVDANFNSNDLFKATNSQLHWQNASLYFIGEDVVLQIGEEPVDLVSLGGDPPQYEYVPRGARLVCLSNFEIQFEGESENLMNQKLRVGPGSIVEYYGLPSNQNQTNIVGSGTIELEGAGCMLYDCGILLINSLPANVVIHGGAILRIPDYCVLHTFKGIIDCQFERSVASINSTFLPITGQIDITGTMSASNSRFKGRANVASVDAQLNISKSLSGVSLIGSQITAFECSFQSESEGDIYRIQAVGNTSSNYYRSISIDNCYLGDATFKAIDPVQHISFIQNNCSVISDETMLQVIRQEDFAIAPVLVSDNDVFLMDGECNGIHLSGFDMARSINDIIVVEDNVINAWPDQAGFGIKLENTNGIIINNTIHGGGYMTYGIIIDGSSITGGNTSFICSNTIENCIHAGIDTKDWKGFAMLNEVTSCGIGHIVRGSASNNAHIHYSTYENCTAPGLQLLAPGKNLFMNVLYNTAYSIYGYNIVAHNNQGETSGQMEVQNDAILHIESPLDDYNGGKNNIIANEEGDFFVFSPNSGTVESLMGENYWAVGSGSGTPYDIVPTNDPYFSGITYIEPTWQASSPFTAPSLECGSGIVENIITPKSVKLTSEASDLSCGMLLQRVMALDYDRQYQQAYDSIKLYMENCYNDVGAAGQFSEVTSMAYPLIVDQIETTYNLREWLKKVLYLSPKTGWYCSDASEIVISYAYPLEGNQHHIEDGNAAISILRYLIDSANCTNFLSTWVDVWKDIRKAQYRFWRDTVQDSSKTPFAQDTLKTYTLDDLDLSILRGPKSGVVEEERVPRFGEMYVRRNPFTDVVELRYELLRDTWSKVEVYDMLGRSLYTESTGFQAKGEHNITIDGRQWSSGTYYLRLSSVSGDVKTVKVAKQ